MSNGNKLFRTCFSQVQRIATSYDLHKVRRGQGNFTKVDCELAAVAVKAFY